MVTADIMPPPNLKSLLDPPNKFEREQAAFRRLLPKLLEKYRNQYVAIHEEQVVGTGADLVTVTLAAYDCFGYLPIYVDLVSDEPGPPERVPHFKPLPSRQ